MTTRTAHERRDKRYPFRMPATLYGRAGDARLTTGDVSYRGVFVQTNSPPKARQLVRVLLSLPEDFEASAAGGAELLLTGMVVHVIEPNASPGRAPGVGLEFYGLHGELRERWERFIQYVAQHSESVAEPATSTPPTIVDPVPRRDERQATELRMLIEAPDDNPAWVDAGEVLLTQDISGGRMFIRTTLPLSVGGGIRVVLRHPPSVATFALECVVRTRVFGSKAGLSVELLEMNDARWRALAEFVKPFGPAGGGGHIRGKAATGRRPPPLPTRAKPTGFGTAAHAPATSTLRANERAPLPR
jgi:hypothetical protein